MLHAKLTPAGHIVGLATNPFAGSTQVAEDAPAIAVFRAWGTSDPAEIARLMAARVDVECRRRVDALIGTKRASMLSYLGALNAKRIDGVPLTAEEAADRALILSLDVWEGEMVEARQALVELAEPSFADDAHWPAAPAGVTAVWLAGF